MRVWGYFILPFFKYPPDFLKQKKQNYSFLGGNKKLSRTAPMTKYTTRKAYEISLSGNTSLAPNPTKKKPTRKMKYDIYFNTQ